MNEYITDQRDSRTTEEAPGLWPGATNVPPSLITDEQQHILSIRGDVTAFLQLQPSQPTRQLAAIIRPELREALHEIITRAVIRRRPAESQPIALPIDTILHQITLIAQPKIVPGQPMRLQIFFDAVPLPTANSTEQLDISQTEAHNHADLVLLQERYTQLIRHYAQAYEELHLNNDALQTLNEELAIASQELAEHREELQTSNQELIQANLRQKRTLIELRNLNTDLEHLIASTEIGILFLDHQLRIKRFTPPIQAIYQLLPTDRQRFLSDLNHQLTDNTLMSDITALLASGQPRERVVRNLHGRWFLARLAPYINADGQPDGIVLTFLDITERQHAAEILHEAYAELEDRVLARTKELAQSHAARQALLHVLVQAQEAERHHIARELHDRFGQQITAILLGLQALKTPTLQPPALVEQVDYLRAIVQTMSQEIHQLAIDLRPTALDDIGIASALQAFAEDWSHRTGIALESYIIGVERVSIPSEIAITVYRIVLEALTNIVRHAAATRVSLILEYHGTTLVAVVEDNGRGFIVEPPNGQNNLYQHLGLIGMHERVGLLGGTVSIESSIGHGTTVIVRIPLPNA